VTYRRRAGKIHDYGAANHGALGLEEGIGWGLTVSCNVFFATLATQIGPDRLSQTIRDAGLRVAPGAKTLASYLPEAGFGQVVVKVTPLEMARLAGAIGRANEEEPGCVEPFWIEKTRTERGEPAPIAAGRAGSPRPERYRPFSPEVARGLREMMLGVVSDPSGTAYGAFHDGAGAPVLGHLEVGGKTGTAEFEKMVKRRDGKLVPVKRKHAWFVGFAHDPRRFPRKTVAVAVLIEDVRGRGTGGTVAAPVARDLIAAVLPPDGSDGGSPPPGGQDWLGNLLDRIDSGVGTVRRLRRMFDRE
jgi:peptidoglycan glycosyltransferase